MHSGLVKSTENHPPQIVEVKRYSPWFTFGPHSHANIEINFVRQGYCFMRIDKDVIAYREGDIMVIFPDTPHYFYVEDRAATLVQLEFQTDRLPNLAEILAHNQSLSIFRTIRRRSRNHLKIVNQPTLTALLHTIVREHHQALPGSARLLELYYEQLLIMLSRHITSQQVSGEKPGKDLVQKALDILYNSLHEPPAVSLLASHCGVSGRYLQRFFAYTRGTALRK